MHEELIFKIENEIKQIEKLLTIHDSLIKLCKIKNPDSTEISAVGSILHSLYNEIEKIFLFIAKNFDNEILTGKKWHRNLIIQLSKSTKNRKALLNENVKNIVLSYLGFRHYFRHSYDFLLDWNLIKDNFLMINNNWNEIKKAIYDFINSIKS